jgi:hypothetical protein
MKSRDRSKGVGTARRRLRIGLALLLALCLAIGLAAGDAAAKKKKKTASVFAGSVSPNLAVPDVPTGPPPVASSTLTVGKKFKGKVVGDVNVTGITTTGSGAGAADNLTFRLIAPNGRSVRLINSIGDQSIGPLTLDDDTTVEICNTNTPPCDYPVATLNRPFAGTANLQYLGSAGTGPLSKLNGLAMRGTWTLQVWDNEGVTTSTLNGWGLLITAPRPVT